MESTNKDTLNKISDIKAQIILYEKEYITSNNKLFKFVQKKRFRKKYNQIKYSILLLVKNSDYYEFERDILTNNELEIELFNNKHFEFISELIKFYNLHIIPLIKLASKLDLITRLQYNLVKKISKKITNVWKIDNVFYELYENEYLIIPSSSETNYFFNMLDIIIEEIKNISKETQINKNNILDDKNYLKLFNEYKKIINSNLIFLE